jgi:ADP-ribosyl-[dinitrogen reductase] hydrolase
MIGAVAGDIIGSIYEWDNHRSKDFPLFKDECFFTDDTVCTVALADCLMSGGDSTKYLQDYCRKFPNRGYGGMFNQWIDYKNPAPYNSYGNGAAMRISPVAFALNDWEQIEKKTIEFTEVTHNHPLGIAGALATSEAIFKAKTATDKSFLVDILTKYYPTFDMTETVDSLRKHYQFNETCQGTVPQALICVIYSTDFEDAIRNAISIGGDSDTLACIVGGIAEAYYKGVPNNIQAQVFNRLPPSFVEVITKFKETYKL